MTYCFLPRFYYAAMKSYVMLQCYLTSCYAAMTFAFKSDFFILLQCNFMLRCYAAMTSSFYMSDELFCYYVIVAKVLCCYD